MFFLDRQEFPDPLGSPRVHYGFHKIPPIDHIVSQFNRLNSPIYASVFVADYFLQIFHIFGPMHTARSPQILPLIYITQKIYRVHDDE